MPKWLFWIAIFFVLFLIYTQPANAGNYAGNFAEFAVNLLDAMGEFLTGLFDGASGDAGGSSGSTSTGSTGSTTVDSDGASFSHFHGGETHTHD